MTARSASLLLVLGALAAPAAAQIGPVPPLPEPEPAIPVWTGEPDEPAPAPPQHRALPQWTGFPLEQRAAWLAQCRAVYPPAGETWRERRTASDICESYLDDYERAVSAALANPQALGPYDAAYPGPVTWVRVPLRRTGECQMAVRRAE